MRVFIYNILLFLFFLPSIHTFVALSRPRRCGIFTRPRFINPSSFSPLFSKSKITIEKKITPRELNLDLNTTYASSPFQYRSLYNTSSLSFKQSIFPSSIGRELKYDPLVANSLEAVELYPFIPKKKNDDFLLAWWKGMKAWGLLSESLILEVEGSQHFNSTSSNLAEDSSALLASRLRQVGQRHRARVICLGDAHGCLYEVQELLRQVELQPGDVVLFLGDMVEKGPYSAEVLRLAMDIGAVGVRGNHDHRLIRRCANSLKKLQEESPEEYRHFLDENLETPERIQAKSKIPPASWPRDIGFREITLQEFKWLSELPVYIKSPDLGCAFVHGGFDDSSTIKKSSGFDKNGVTPSEPFVSEFDFMAQSPITMMTLRSVSAQNLTFPTSSLASELGTSTQCSWASLWQGPYTVIFGHDSKRGLHKYPNALGLDTGCVYGGRLTAVILPEGDIVSTAAHKSYIPPK